MTSFFSARWWEPLPDGRLRCTLCPRDCKIGLGKAGFCFIRQNHEGQLVTMGTNHPMGLCVDPIEKKPLYHFMPGTPILSFGTAGCNLGCRFCQNHEMSKARAISESSYELNAEGIVKMALQENCPSIAMTYNDPTIFGEYAIEVNQAAKKMGLKTVLVTAGYICPEPRNEIYQGVSAANIDIKGFTEDFYRKWTISELAPVLETVEWAVKKGIWVELTTLLIPTLNDHPTEIKNLAEWILTHLGPDVPLHFSAFHPDFKLIHLPATPPATVIASATLAREMGIHYVYTGNIRDPEGQSTRCSECHATLIKRNWHAVTEYHLENGRCPTCGKTLAGYFGSCLPRLHSGSRKKIDV